jgi:hypothetical protein
VRSGKYFFGFFTSRETGLETTHMWWFRMAHAFGFPVVPDVKTKTARSVIVAFAGGDITEGVIDGSFGAGIESNDDRFRVK